MEAVSGSGYLKTLQKRASKSNISQEFQLIGLEVAAILHDIPHKALYIKYVKEYGPDRILSIAKDIAERKDVQNHGAYFMTVLASMKEEGRMMKEKK